MTADEFSKIVRGGSDKLRVDNIVLTFGGQEFHGSGTMQIEQDEIKLVVHLNGEEKFPDPKLGIHTKRDTWQLNGVIEYHLEFQCDRAGIVSPRDRFDRWQTFDLNPVYLVPSGLDAMSSRERTAFITQGESENQSITNEDNSVRLTALLQEYPFFEKLCGKKWEGEIEGFNFTLQKENKAADVEVTMTSKQGYISAGQAEDENKFQAVMSSLAFIVGANAWPYRIEHWRGGKKVLDVVRATGKLSKISHTPFTNFLAQEKIFGNVDWDFLDILKKGTAFFEANSTLSKEISNLLYLFRQADAKAVHSDITMIAVCALFENLVQMIFRELKLEDKARDEQGVFKDAALQAFENVKQKLKAELSPQVWRLARDLFEGGNLSEQEPQVGAGSKLFIKAKNKPNKQFDGRVADECEGWHRMFKRIADTPLFSTRKKFQAVLNHFQFDQHWRTEMERAFSTWENARHKLVHLKERTTLTEDDQKKDVADQCQIAGAVNVLVLKVIGYSGLMRANTLSQNYR